jgi:hypothetical protein
LIIFDTAKQSRGRTFAELYKGYSFIRYPFFLLLIEVMIDRFF